MTKEERKEYDRKRYLANRERILEQKREYHQANRDKRLEQMKEWREANKEKILEYQKEYRQANREKRLEYFKEYRNTQIGRAVHLLNRYNQSDREANRGQGDLTAEWIIENIFSKPCKHCGKTGWDVIGCNRLDNSKPHTKDNVEPCCFECNVKLAALDRKKGDD